LTSTLAACQKSVPIRTPSDGPRSAGTTAGGVAKLCPKTGDPVLHTLDSFGPENHWLVCRETSTWLASAHDRGRMTRKPEVETAGRGGAKMNLPGETEAGTAGTQPCRGIARWAHRDDEQGAEVSLLRSSRNRIGSVDPDALKIPARRAEYSLTESALSPFQAEPTQARSTRRG
jgi:hypothetical protein